MYPFYLTSLPLSLSISLESGDSTKNALRQIAEATIVTVVSVPKSPSLPLVNRNNNTQVSMVEKTNTYAPWMDKAKIVVEKECILNLFLHPHQLGNKALLPSSKENTTFDHETTNVMQPDLS